MTKKDYLFWRMNMKLPLHDATILYAILNPMDKFCEFVIARNDGEQNYLVRILVIGIKNILSMGLLDLTVFYSSTGDVDYAYLQKTEKEYSLKIGGITNDYDADTNQINWELNFTAEKIFYEEKKIKVDEDDLYLADYGIGSKNIPSVGNWEAIEYEKK